MTITLTPTEIALIEGLTFGYEDMPYAAWQAACINTIARYTDFKHRDPEAIFIAWVEQTGRHRNG